MLIAFLAYKDQFAQKAIGLIDKFSDVKVLDVHADRLSDIVLTEPESLVGTVKLDAELNAAPRLEVDVSFRYADGLPLILDGCKFEVSSGECIAVVGPSGCGKSTLVRILVGILEPTAGSVRLGGLDVRDIGLEAYRGVIGAVMQNDDLFAGTIEENIAFFDPSPDIERVRSSACLAALDKDIEGMPMKYRTPVGDMGSALSGGQKQRVLLARALYRSPRILVLDEATSHLDVISERAVNQAVSGIHATRIFVAHRPDTVTSADRVIVMGNGRIERCCSPGEWLESIRSSTGRAVAVSVV
ncbi:ATP-binding cassette domain-containing protein [Frateuria defendens]|uniref:ATP-binding cassette domain-containing protein n=1 Tax=Frateuria defendens TaxID=2219559 RepID=UPI00069DCBF6|nr:ATP-binding cassette domain-containing protein [Frateuria defendens]